MNKHTILLVDDKPTNLEVLFEYLEEYDFDLRVATDGKMALKIVNRAPPDLILLDVMMPIMGGFETCKRLKANDLTKDIPIIFITALSDIEQQVKGFQIGAADYITKPIKVEIVLARVQTHLALRDAQKKLEAKNTKLEQSEAKFRSLIENSPDIITIVNPEGTLLFINHDIPDYTIKDMIGSSVYQYLPSNQHQIYLNTLTHVFQTGESCEIELTETNGQVWESRFVPIEYGNKIASLMIVATNITERKQIEAAIKKANKELEQSMKEMAILNYIVQTISSLTDLQSVLEIILEAITQFFNTQGIVLSLLDDTRTQMTVLAHHQLTQTDSDLLGLTTPINKSSVIQQVLETGQAIVIPQAQTNPLTKRVHRVLTKKNIHCLLVTPLQIRGAIIGLFTLTSNQVNYEFTKPEVELAETIATQVAGTIENARLFEKEHHQREVAESLQEVALALNNSLDYEIVLAEIMKQLQRVIEYDSGGIFIQIENHLILLEGVKLAIDIGYAIPLSGEEPATRAFKSKKPVIIPDVYEEPHWQVSPKVAHIRSWMGIPLLHNQKAVGVLTIDNFKVNAYDSENAQIAQIFANQAAIAIQNAHLFNQVTQAQKETEIINQALIKANERMQNELSLAQTIQYGLLSAPHPNWSNLNVVCYTTPASKIGGDFYAYHMFDTQRYTLAIGDISGKGVSAALLMATSLSLFDATLSQDFSPTERLVHLDEVITPYTKPHTQNCAMCYLEIILRPTSNPSTMPRSTLPLQTEIVGSLHIVNAGCIPPYIKHKNGSVTWPQIGGFALGQGLGSQIGYKQINLNLAKGDMIILTSDGAAEAKNKANELLGFEQLEQMIKHGPQSNPEKMLDHLKKSIFSFMGETEQYDDLTIVVIEI